MTDAGWNKASMSETGAVATVTERLPRLLYGISLFVIVNYVALVCVYLLLDNFFDYVEPGLLSVASLVAQGQPMYHSASAAAQYNFMYGPMLFLVNASVLKLLGPSLFAGKLAGGVFSIGSVALLFDALRRRYGTRCAVIGAGLLVFSYFAFWPYNTFIARADPLVLGFVALGLWGALLPRAWLAALVLAVAAGAATNVKAHAGAYLLPAAVLLLEQHGWRWVVAAVLGALVVLAAPFALFSDVSTVGYIHTMLTAAHPGLDWHAFLDRVEQMLIFQALPTLMVLLVVEHPLAHFRRDRFYLAALGVSTAVVLLVASHPGAGKVHLVPLSISLVFWLAAVMRDDFAWSTLWAQRGRRARVRTWVALLLFIDLVCTVIPVNLRMVKLIHAGQQTNGAVEDLHEIMLHYPDRTLAMGYGTTQHNEFTWYRPLLVFAGNPYLIDESSMGDLELAGWDLPQATLDALADCKVDIWLIPKGDPPFVLSSSLGFAHLFSQRFRDAFLAHYQRRAQSQYYDLYFCKRPAAQR